jgi:hypothetical protein
MRARSDEAARAAIGAAARELRLPTIRSEASRLAEIAARERQSYLARVSKDLVASAVFPQAQLFSIFSLAYYPRQRCGAYRARSNSW